MRINEIEIAAAHNKQCPKMLSAPELCLYCSFRNLYADWHKGNISKNDASIIKNKIISEYVNFKEAYDHCCEVYKSYQDNIRFAGTLLSDIEKSQDITEIAHIACEVIGLMTGDREFLKRQLKKIK